MLCEEALSACLVANEGGCLHLCVSPLDFLSATDTPPSLCFLGEVGVSVSVVFVAVFSFTLLATGEVVAIASAVEISQWLSFSATDTHSPRPQF